jgi:multiple sugar transport system substrate-binding protein
MYSYGATEVQEDGKTPGFNTPEFTDALQKFVQAWKDGFDDTGLSWDDSSNNKAYLADQLSITNNGSSIYLAALKDQPDIAKDTDHAVNPAGPKGRFSTYQTQEMAILSYSKNQAAAKEFLKYFFSDAVYTKWYQSQKGYHVPPTKGKFLDDSVFTSDPKLKAFLDQAKILRLPGYAAPPGPAVANSMANYVIVDLFAKAVQTGNAKQAIADAVAFLERNREALARTSLAVFALGPQKLEDAALAESLTQLGRSLAKAAAPEPQLVTVFGGVVDPAKLRFPLNRLPASDARDWAAIRAWAAEAAAVFRAVPV